MVINNSITVVFGLYHKKKFCLEAMPGIAFIEIEGVYFKIIIIALEGSKRIIIE